MSLSPLGPQGKPFHRSHGKEPLGSPNDGSYMSIPATSGSPLSPEEVAKNCLELEKWHLYESLPALLREIIEIVKSKQGNIPNGDSVYKVAYAANIHQAILALKECAVNS